MKALERQKLFEAIAFFLANTKYCGLVKLFKLLYYMDMLNFRETGRAVTGLSYQCWPYGPVPSELYEEIKRLPQDLAEHISVEAPPADIESANKARTVIKAKKKYQSRFLTKREQRIAREMAEVFYEANADQISESSHARNGPWDLAKRISKGKWGQPISYFDSINLEMGSGKSVSLELLKDRFKEFEEDRDFFHEKG